MKRKNRVLLLLVGIGLLSLAGCKKELPVEEEDALEVAVDSGDTAKGDNIMDAGLVPEEGAKLIFWTPDIEFGEAVGKKFEEKYGVPVTVEENGLGTIDKIALSGPAGTGADIFMSPHDSFVQGVSSGVFLELNETVVSNLKERINEVGINTVTSEGKLYGAPISLETTCLFYNKDLVQGEPAKTFEEIMVAAKTFNDPENNLFYFLNKIADGYKVYPFLSSAGFCLFGEDGTDADNPGFDTDEFEEGLTLIGKLHEIMPINSTDLSNDSFLKNQFAEGKAAYEFSGPWDITEFKNSGVNFGVTTLPTYNGKALTPFAGVQNAHVSAFTVYPDAAQLFIEYLVSDEAAGLLYEKANKITTLKDISKVRGLADDEYIRPFVEQFANSWPMPSVKRISYYWTISASLAQSVFDGQLTPAEGRQKAIKDWETMLTTE
ncbi:carbohydrate ABC transporter substrate-binding protein (CUT1 family) [Mobilisporobacter senegalensis]|uniref:Carbohydrate ABC transporter substrate-binding protein (CUT1 family) n=1 Tax=Mobilisporobacter senegalensis TaxID=1329262 RepID=A0A3N1X9H7_9FIRM|nr:maltose ABC transporter substrate-binding protein [Mobilisporobacter senegalensis]ROR23419.1 carbohydrate ABC transporter substrate-binding protein (CUT1 family) [Mobilisporobacter senegalensis]